MAFAFHIYLVDSTAKKKQKVYLGKALRHSTVTVYYNNNNNNNNYYYYYYK